jgi:hypothetical protein
MNNNQKMLLGVAVVGVAAYYYWKSQQPKKQFVGANGSLFAGRPNKAIFAGADGKYGNFAPQASCMCHTGETKVGPKGDTVYTCKNGNVAFKSGGACGGGQR